MSDSNDLRALRITITICAICSCVLLLFAETAGIITGVNTPFNVLIRACMLAGFVATVSLVIHWLKQRKFTTALVVGSVYIAGYLLISRSVYLPIVWPAAYSALFILLLTLRTRQDKHLAT